MSKTTVFLHKTKRYFDESRIVRRLGFVSFVVLLLLVGFIFLFPKKNPEKLIQNGTADLSALNEGALSLSGDWELLEVISAGEPILNTTVITTLPAPWARPYGYAAYRARLIGLRPDIPWALSVPGIDTSYRITVNGVEVMSAGIPGKTETDTVSGYRTGIASVPIHNGEAEILLEVANFIHMTGGPSRAILIGEEGFLRKYDTWSFITELITIGIMLFLGGLSLMSAYLKRSLSSLYFGLLLVCGAFGIFAISPDCPIYRVFPNLPVTFYIRLAYAVCYLVPLWFFLVSRSLFGGITTKQTLFLAVPSAALFLFTLILPVTVFAPLNPLYQINSLALFALSIVIFARAMRKSYAYAKSLSIGFLVFLGTALGVLLYTNNRIDRGVFSALSFLYPLFGITLTSSFVLDVASYILSIVGLNSFCVLFFIDAPKVTQPSGSALETGYKERVSIKCAALDFSPREAEVVMLALEGKRNKEIAEALFVSENTVKTHLSRVFAKAGIKARSELFAIFSAS